MSTIININGQDYEITNWEEFKQQLLFLLGETIVNAIQDEAIKQGLYEHGDLVRGYRWVVEGDTLIITNDVPHAAPIEYGTYEFGKLYASDGFPDVPFTKKKHMKAKELEGYPRGAQPFAPVRRVIYNELKMEQLVTDACGGGTPT